MCSSSIIVKRMSRLIIARDLHLSGSQRMIPGNIQRSLMESPIFSPVLIRQAILDLIFEEKIQIWDKLLKISHRFRLQNTIGND